MRQKHIFSIACLLAFAAVTSCQKPETPPVTPPATTPDKEIVLRAKITTELTRAGADSETMVVKWSQGDNLGFFYNPEGYDDEKLVNVEMNCESMSTDGTEGSFTSSTAPEWRGNALSHRFWAVYPYVSTNKNLSALKVNIPTEVADQDGALFAGMFMVGQTTTTEVGEDGELLMDFTTPLAFVKVTLDASGSLIDSEDLAGATVSSSFPIAGDATYDMTTKTLSDSDKKEITFSYQGGAVLSGTREFYFAVNPNADLSASNANFKLTLEGAAFDAEFDLALESSLQAGKMQTIAVNVEDAVAAGKGRINLDGEISQDLANCYIVAPGGKFILPVKQAYNAWKDYFGEPIADNVTLTAELLWMDTEGGFSNASAISAISMFQASAGENAGIYIKAGSASGNAVVALKADGSTIWSWHIWVTDYNPETTNVTIPSATSTFPHVLMNRNLGATSTTPGDVNTTGLGYQFGRKDPFPSFDGTRPENAMTQAVHRSIYNGHGTQLTVAAAGTGISFGNPMYENDVQGIKYAVQNPSKYILSTTTPNTGNVYCWTTSIHAASRGPNSLKFDMWGFSGPTGIDLGKTVFDPCPTGWRVPGDPGITVTLTGVYSADKVQSKKGVDFGEYGFFPYSGYIYGDGGNGGYWCEPTYLGAMWYGRQGGFGAMALAFAEYHTNGMYSANQAYYPVYGLPVRCEKEW